MVTQGVRFRAGRILVVIIVIIAFCVGMLVSVVALGWCRLLGWIPPTDSTKLIQKWNITEDNSDPNVSTLLVKSRGNPGEYINAAVDHFADGVTRAGVLVDKDVGKNELTPHFLAIFYTTKGSHGTPEVIYGRKSTNMWHDKNGDGVIDEELDYVNRVVRINMGNEWLEGKKESNVVQTSRGSFRFDYSLGQWKRVDPNDKEELE